MLDFANLVPRVSFSLSDDFDDASYFPNNVVPRVSFKRKGKKRDFPLKRNPGDEVVFQSLIFLLNVYFVSTYLFLLLLLLLLL